MQQDIHAHRILIVDFGSQYTQLIARRVREAGVYCEIWPYDNCEGGLDGHPPSGVILSGGPETVTAEHTPRVPQRIFDLGVPVLGICYGMQTMAAQLGGEVASSEKHEYGYARVRARGHSRLLRDIEDHTSPEGWGLLDVWMSHGDRVEGLPPGFSVICETDNAPLAGMADESRGFYGVQFHPEVTHTRQGKRIVERFLFEICGCEAAWNAANIIEDSIAQVRERVGDVGRVVLGLSGGVDSSVVAALLHRAVGDRLTCIFVDNGLLRHQEATSVVRMFRDHFNLEVVAVDAADEFLAGLAGVTDPEQKRKFIGATFIDVFEREARKVGNAKWLAQGTLYPDVIESVPVHGSSALIKSHHNVGGLPERMQLKLIEPLRELFKDEVRAAGVALGLPKETLGRHPFPGPGLAVRCVGEITRERLEVLRAADRIFIDELRAAGLYDKVWQAFCVLLPVRTVGVMGDERTYDEVIAVRAIHSSDGMTADWARLPYELLATVSNRIINEVKGVNRVVYDIASKPPATIEWE